MKLIAVNGRRYTPEVLRDASRAAKEERPRWSFWSKIPITTRHTNSITTGAKNIRTSERDESKPDLLSEILKAK